MSHFKILVPLNGASVVWMLGVLSFLFFCAVGHAGVYNDLAVTDADFGPDVAASLLLEVCRLWSHLNVMLHVK